MRPSIHPLFFRTAPNIPLVAELFQYEIDSSGGYTLEARYLISRTTKGSVYLGMCETPLPFGEPGSQFAVVVIWDVITEQFILCAPGAPDQVEDLKGGIFPAGVGAHIALDAALPPLEHLGFKVHAVKRFPTLWYCPRLELALLYREKTDVVREYVIQTLTQGEPAIHEMYR